jgi:hypothetical protein
MVEGKRKREKPYSIKSTFDEAMKKILSAPAPKKEDNHKQKS